MEDDTMALELSTERSATWAGLQRRYWAGGTPQEVGRLRHELQDWVQALPEHAEAWLYLGTLQEHQGQAPAAAWAYLEAISRAQMAGQWRDNATTPVPLRATVAHAVGRLRGSRRLALQGALQAMCHRHGKDEMARVSLAVAGYLKEQPVPTHSPHQVPKFFHFPGLRPGPFFSADDVPFAPALRQAFPEVRAEAARLYAQGAFSESFIPEAARPGMAGYVAGPDGPGRWDAYFFFRRGRRFDAHHDACPATSRLLASIDLCRIPSQTPEICFSLLAAGSTILPHHGTSNIRLVVHLPLIVPPDCALHVFGGGEAAWGEGEVGCFDDTFLHEAWNRSGQDRIILLMDSWHPDLTRAEREAVCLFVDLVDRWSWLTRG
ncbi:aspartyl/asparaginyl beta-hydroxylase domain-containing protein [Ideonella livida]|uniref:Aspartyl/asparaginyl beta-hydroxylase domain-containing protein n=1 Tax=Ideonella livida TaxID=2707176 RepID=A0A7C9TH09_9BURK|nr:aspartyl/asparaginyl beta-hydroxylase domain-containing protein [Ideonella livida]NDY90100.1 aspartyl/asparaginyl beta-hydroxylase domain-containing protein [Ideonella livida]